MKLTFFIFLASLLFFSAVFAKEDVKVDDTVRFGHLVPLCGDCHYNSDCKSYYCYEKKCVPRHDYKFCLSGECGKCTDDKHCKYPYYCHIPPHAHEGKCITAHSKYKCFPPLKKEECEPCKKDKDCKSHKCFRPKKGKGKKCVFNTPESIKKCFGLPECAYCTKSEECHSKLCYKYKCIFHTKKSKIKCGLLVKKKKLCAPCTKDEECKSHVCYNHKCVKNRYSFEHCFHRRY